MGAVPPAFTAIRLLLADDHRLVVEALRALLASDPRLEIVGAAYDGQQAVELAAELEPDVVLMDIAMPVLDGIEATRRITDANPDIRVLMLTGSDWNVDSSRARSRSVRLHPQGALGRGSRRCDRRGLDAADGLRRPARERAYLGGLPRTRVPRCPTAPP